MTRSRYQLSRRRLLALGAATAAIPLLARTDLAAAQAGDNLKIATTFLPDSLNAADALSAYP